MQALGIDLKQFLFQLLNFGVLFFGLYYLLNKPLIKLLDQRRTDTKDTRELAEKMRKENEVAAERQQALFDKAQKEAAELLHLAKQQGKELEERLSSEAQAKAEKLLERTRQDIAREKDEMKRELKEELVGIVVTASEKIFTDSLPVADKQKQISKLLKELS